MTTCRHRSDDAKSGEVVWKHDTVVAFGAQVPEWGFAGSPVVDGDDLIVHLGAKDGACVMEKPP